MSGPIRPNDVGEAKRSQIPKAVFDAFNAEITEHFTQGRAIVYQRNVVRRLRDPIDEQLARDRRLYGNSFEMRDASGKRTRLDPRTVTIRNRSLQPRSPYEPRSVYAASRTVRCPCGVHPLNYCRRCD